MLWTEILSGQFEAAVEKAKGVCALVVGGVEQHGNHLPMGQDVIHAGGVTELAAQKEPVVIFPHMYFGEKQGAGEYPGTIMFSSKLLFDILTESCAEIAGIDLTEKSFWEAGLQSLAERVEEFCALAEHRAPAAPVPIPVQALQYAREYGGDQIPA